jgi:hypothetical protein
LSRRRSCDRQSRSPTPPAAHHCAARWSSRGRFRRSAGARGESESLITVAEAEALARLAPDRDWRIHFVSLLEDRHYRREAVGRWRLYKRGYGLS